ncbi:MAG: chemotaxis response regulator protein-glutamate methylesterase [Verrucomicrobia bacterium]|nr:chemotaxis response regulator protein-glutamate methylesterase [Verrucomicrobiota bacterium]
MRIAIVNDMPMAVEALRRVVMGRSEHSIAWVAANGAEAVDACAGDVPDLILMDLIMPVMDGVEATRRIMAKTPCPILIVTVSVEINAAKVFAAMGAGALDAVDTPTLGMDNALAGAARLLDKINLLGRCATDLRGASRIDEARAPQPAGHIKPQLVAIGSSAGGPAALAALLAKLPLDFPAAVVIVQHVDQQFAASFAEWLNNQSTLPVRVAVDGDRPLPGKALVAGTNDHLALAQDGRLNYTAQPQDNVYRPSADVFFESVVQHWRSDAVGVLLTGMGRDGARGLKRMRDSGFHTITQDKASCAVYGMPKAAAQLGAAADILPLDQIAPALERWSRARRENRAKR